MPEEPLAIYTTAELIEELNRRSKALVVGFDPLADRSMFTVIRCGSVWRDRV